MPLKINVGTQGPALSILNEGGQFDNHNAPDSVVAQPVQQGAAQAERPGEDDRIRFMKACATTPAGEGYYAAVKAKYEELRGVN